MRISDWSSDVCSSDLLVADARSARRSRVEREIARLERILTHTRSRIVIWRARLGLCRNASGVLEKVADLRRRLADRQSVVEGKRGSVRVDLGGRLILKKTK